MTDRIALVLGAALLVAIAVDLTLNDAHLLLFFARKLADTVEYLSFWR